MIELLARNYNWFLIVAIVLSFALIGYIIEKKGKKEKSIKEINIEKEIENFETITDPNMTLGDAMKKSETIIQTPEPIVVKDSDSDIEDKEDLSKMIIDEPDS